MGTTQELPPITNYPSEIYKAGNQNWSITESDTKFIYVANNEGLLAFNGANWTLYPSPNKTIIRSVCAVNDKVYSGSYMDFGYWELQNNGTQQYTSLTTTLEIDVAEDEQFWSITPFNKWILFQSLSNIYIFNTEDKSIKVIDSDKTIHKLFEVDHEIFFYVIDDGLYTIQNGTKKKVHDAGEFNNDIIVQLLSLGTNVIAVTQNSGLFSLSDQKVEIWDISVEKEIENTSIYTAIALTDGSLLLGSIGNGIIQISADGKQLFNINQFNGLGDNTALSLFEDSHQNIWVGLDNGLDCVNIRSPYLNYIDRRGRLGTTYASIIFNDLLYLGTNQGLFYKSITSKDDFKLIRGTEGQVWCLENIGETLFCGHNAGTFQVQGTSATLVSNVMGTWGIKNIPGTTQMVLQGNYNGLHILENKNGVWNLKNKLKGFDISSRYFEFTTDNTVLVSHEYKGVYALEINQDFTEVTQVKKDSSVVKGSNSSIAKFYDTVLYANEEGVFEYDLQNKIFNRESQLSTLFTKESYVSGKLETNVEEMLWFFTNDGIAYITKEPFTDSYVINTMQIPLALRKEKKGYENVSKIGPQEYLFGTSNGYILMNTNDVSDQDFTVYLNTVKAGNSKEEVALIDKDKKNFKANENCFVFEYSVPEYDTYKISEYQYLLGEDAYSTWSDWTTNTSISFENLSYGDYSFSVRAKINNTLQDNVATFSFTIERPWYLSMFAIFLYVVAFVLFFLTINAWYKRNYKKEKRRLLEKNTRELAVKELEAQKEIIQLKNENLNQDIEARNRELAVSTMSMIKKNNVLNDFKAELLKISEIPAVAPLVKKINKSLNDKEDWSFFEEAFNHADKDFFKKVKELHPELTANDLRLCVYLRLNLSSKEIAPLLNISHRSVEIKRYRLRKKINLDHKVNLNNYFIDL